VTANPLRAARGTTTTLATRVLALGELAYNTTTLKLHAGDGVTAGGKPLVDAASDITISAAMEPVVEAATLPTAQALLFGTSSSLATTLAAADLFEIRDYTASAGAYVHGINYGPDSDTNFPYFAVRGDTDRGRVMARSQLWCYDLNDGFDLLLMAQSGTASSPSVRTAPCRAGHIYNVHRDATGNVLIAAANMPLETASYTGRSGNVSFFIIETPTQTARGGGIEFGACRTGGDASDPQVVPYATAWLKNGGVIAPGLAAVVGPTGNLAGVDGDARVAAGGARISFPFNYSDSVTPNPPGDSPKINCPGYVNWYNTDSTANFTAIASHYTKGFAAISIRGEIDTSCGFDWLLDQPDATFTNWKYGLFSVNASTRTARLWISNGGILFPADDGVTDLGKTTNRFLTLLARRGNFSQPAQSTSALFLKNSHASFDNTIIEGQASIAAATGWDCLKFSSAIDSSPATVFRVNGRGAIFACAETAIPAGGTAGRGVMVSTTTNFGVFFGSGAPTLSAAKGSLYLRSDGSGTSDRAYINTDSGTTWTSLTTAA